MAKNDNKNDKNQPDAVNFALLISRVEVDGKIGFNITSKNQGIADPDIILIVESWLEKVKDNFKNNVKNSIQLNTEERKK